MTTIAALIVAAGRGTRVSGADLPKQFLTVAGEMLLTRTLRPFLAHPAFNHIQVVIHPDNRDLYKAATAGIGPASGPKLRPPASGGTTRQASVDAGLRALADAPPDLVLIHDAARPFVTGDMLNSLLERLEYARAAILASPLTDTLKRVDDLLPPTILETVPRERLWRAETPQAFRYADIVGAHAAARMSGASDFTDDASLAEWAGIPVVVVDSGGSNTKITTAEDMFMAEQRLAAPQSANETELCIGQGFDVHRFADGDHVWLCGVKVPHSRGVEAHSDGDVAFHALTDAILGAIGDGDIGMHFKNTDPRWRNAASDKFLLDAKARVAAAGGSIRHVDITILAEAPRISRYRSAMIQRIAGLLDLPERRVGLKATTTEGLGFPGRGEGLAAMATATVALPPLR